MRGIAMAALLLTGACASTPPIGPDQAALGGEGYRLDSGDKLRITVYNEPALTGEYGITAAGSLSLPLLGDVPAKGLTVAALQTSLRTRLVAADYVKDPRISVEPLNYRPYYILGEVNKPGEYPYKVGLRVEQAVAAAGGYTYRANRGTAFLRRSDDDIERSVKLRKRTFHVLPGDTIRIGERYL